MLTMKEKHRHGDDLFPFELFDQKALKGQKVCYLHWHEEVEWIYVHRGSVDIYIDSILYQVNQGQMMIIEPHLLHYMVASEDCHYYTCVFHKLLLQFYLEDYTSLQFINPYIRNESQIKMPLYIEKTYIQENFLDIVYYYNQDPKNSQLKIKLLLLDIFNSFINQDLIIQNQQKKHNLETIEIVLHYIEEHYFEKITSQFLAHLVNYNHQYFSRFFKENTGYTPIEYINHFRIDKACQLLIHPDYSILDISMNCGFESCSYFIKKFKEYKTVSPRQYRTMLFLSYNQDKAD